MLCDLALSLTFSLPEDEIRNHASSSSQVSSSSPAEEEKSQVPAHVRKIYPNCKVWHRENGDHFCKDTYPKYKRLPAEYQQLLAPKAKTPSQGPPQMIYHHLHGKTGANQDMQVLAIPNFVIQINRSTSELFLLTNNVVGLLRLASLPLLSLVVIYFLKSSSRSWSSSPSPPYAPCCCPQLNDFSHLPDMPLCTVVFYTDLPACPLPLS